jgi:hypothetical protein
VKNKSIYYIISDLDQDTVFLMIWKRERERRVTVALPLRYRRVTVALPSRYRRVTVALPSRYRRVTVA